MAEKRNFFRVNKEVLFDFHGIDAFTADNEDPQGQFDEDLPVQLFASFRQIDKQNREIARTLVDNQRPILDYINGINRKVELLARELVSQKVPEQQSHTKINLSEGGIAFLSDKALYKGAFLAIRLMFLPNYNGVILFAQVTRCEPTKGDNHHIAAKFHRISETQQQVLAKTILDTQLASKRKGQTSKDSADQEPKEKDQD